MINPTEQLHEPSTHFQTNDHYKRKQMCSFQLTTIYDKSAQQERMVGYAGEGREDGGLHRLRERGWWVTQVKGERMVG